MSRVPSGLPAGFSLEAEWEVYRTPFQHVRVRGVFERQTYEAMQQAFRDLRGDDEVRWVRTSSYDAQVLAMNDSLRQRFAGLFDPAFLAYAAELAGGIRTVPLLDGALHHIPQGSRSGWLHTDLCSAWFSNSEGVSAGKAAFADRTQCDYFSGVPRKPEVTPKEFVRAASLLFYLNNAGWEDGDGGETEIYSAGQSDAGPRKTVSPEDNTLLVFENSPHSFHRMIANPGRARNSIVLWLHTDLEFGLSRWGSGVAREGASLRRVCLVTGASGVLGTALCKSWLADCEIVAAYRERVPSPSQLAWSVGNEERRAWCVQADLQDRHDVRRLVEVAMARHGRVDVVVNAAADQRFHGSLLDLSFDPERSEAQMRLNALMPCEVVSRVFQECWSTSAK